MKPIDVLIAISVAVIWGMGFVIAKAGMAHFSPILLMALRFTLTAACLLCFFRPPPGIFKQLFWISLISAALQYSLTFNGVRGIDASTAALLVQLEVPFGLIMAWFVFGDRISSRQALGIMISFAGAVLIIGEPRLAGDLIYAFMVIGGAFTWAIGQIMIKKLGNIGGFRLLSGVALFAAPQLFTASWFIRAESNRADYHREPARLGCRHLPRLDNDRSGLRSLVPFARTLQRQSGYAFFTAVAGDFGNWWYSFPRRVADHQDCAWRRPRHHRRGFDHHTTLSVSAAGK
jgi:uncharacterized membrane protein